MLVVFPQALNAGNTTLFYLVCTLANNLKTRIQLAIQRLFDRIELSLQYTGVESLAHSCILACHESFSLSSSGLRTIS